jgi:hypothetical protein
VEINLSFLIRSVGAVDYSKWAKQFEVGAKYEGNAYKFNVRMGKNSPYQMRAFACIPPPPAY